MDIYFSLPYYLSDYFSDVSNILIDFLFINAYVISIKSIGNESKPMETSLEESSLYLFQEKAYRHFLSHAILNVVQFLIEDTTPKDTCMNAVINQVCWLSIYQEISVLSNVVSFPLLDSLKSHSCCDIYHFNHLLFVKCCR